MDSIVPAEAEIQRRSTHDTGWPFLEMLLLTRRVWPFLETLPPTRLVWPFLETLPPTRLVWPFLETSAFGLVFPPSRK